MAAFNLRSSSPFIGDGEMAGLMRSTDWASMPIGPVEGWPQSLKTAISIVLGSRYPMFVWWGPDLLNFYNDAYRPMLGLTKHPQFLGRPAAECWADIWDVVGPMSERVMRDGEATFSEDLLLIMDRNGYTEESYFTFSYSPILGEDGEVGGVYCAVVETTAQVLAERRLSLLRDLAPEAQTLESASASIEKAIRSYDVEIPFCRVYSGGRLLAATGAGGELTDMDAWPVQAVHEHGGVVHPVSGSIVSGPWPEPIRQAYVTTLPRARAGQTGTVAFGISPRRAFDDEYRSFLDLVAGKIASILDSAEAFEEERERAEALAELDRAKTAFFTNVSHEFRTPLTLMMGPLEDLLAAQQLDDTTRQNVDVAYRNSIRLLRMVNTLLDFSRIEAGRIDAAFEPMNIAVATEELASVFRSAIERAGLRFVVECQPISGDVFVDRYMWEQIVLNLLSNALKHTFAGEIRVSLSDAGDGVELTVSDTGTGIPEPDLALIFERFHRVQEARARTHEGTGIGLALVRELVRLHGGDITVASVNGEGSTFTVRVPKGSSHLPQDRVVSPATERRGGLAARPFVEEAMRWLGEGSDAQQRAPIFDSGRATVLVADDNADMRGYVTRLLGERWNVIAAPDGARALEIASREPIDLVVADIMMPEMDGFGLLAAIRSRPEMRGLPVILLSARAGEEARVEGLAAGADDYLVKPFSANELVARVAAHLSARAAREELLDEQRQQRLFLSAVLQSAPIAMAVMKAPDLEFTLVNPIYQAIVGPEQPLIGRRYREAFAGVAAVEAEAQLLRVIATGETWHVRDFETTVPGREGTTWWEGECVALPNSSGEIDSVLVLTWDITDRKRADLELRESEREIKRQQAELLQALAVKDEFLGLVSHELRTPITTILGNAEVLLRSGDALDEASRAGALSDINENARRLNTIIGDLLAIARAERGTLEPEPLAIGHSIREIIHEYRALSSSRIVLRGDETQAIASCDFGVLSQVLRNYLSNAEKYGRGSEIEVEATVEDDEVLIRVLDRGIGISADEAEALFDPFYRSKDVATLGGMGIGLSVCKRLAEAMGARVWARPREGGGSEFGFAVRRYPDEQIDDAHDLLDAVEA